MNAISKFIHKCFSLVDLLHHLHCMVITMSYQQIKKQQTNIMCQRLFTDIWSIIHKLYVKQVQMYYRSGTGGNCCIGTGQTLRVYSSGGSTFSAWNNVMANVFKVLHQVKNLTLSLDAYLREEHSCQISSRSDLKRRSLGQFLKKLPQQEPQQKDEYSSNMGSVPGQKNTTM